MGCLARARCEIWLTVTLEYQIPLILLKKYPLWGGGMSYNLGLLFLRSGPPHLGRASWHTSVEPRACLGSLGRVIMRLGVAGMEALSTSAKCLITVAANNKDPTGIHHTAILLVKIARSFSCAGICLSPHIDVFIFQCHSR